MSSTRTLRTLQAQPITSENFRPYGQLISATPDHKDFDAQDAQLRLDLGTPRFYIMHLPRRGLKFDKITHHKRCTQCLGSLNGKEWFMGVAPPSETLDPEAIVAFRIPGDCFIKMERGTWHAGPYFEQDAFIDFYNLELTDTNISDHTTIHLGNTFNLEFQIGV